MKYLKNIIPRDISKGFKFKEKRFFKQVPHTMILRVSKVSGILYR